MRHWSGVTSIAALLVLRCAFGAAAAAEFKVAVAANFTEPAREIATTFAARTGHKAVLSFGATGQIYAQIAHGAPFDVFLAADTATPARAVSDGHGVDGTVIVYAVGRLALYGRSPASPVDATTLSTAKFSRLAIANPATAPYGAAAVETLKALGLYEGVQTKLVMGANIAQTLQFVDTGNAEFGFVALSQIVQNTAGTTWLVPSNLHSPIAQAAVLLKVGAENPAARAFLAFLADAEARAIIAKFGYGGAP